MLGVRRREEGWSRGGVLGVEEFRVVVGSVVGREHVRLQKNNQDGVAVRRLDGMCVAAVADGCSSSLMSEVGAGLAVGWLVQHVPGILREHQDWDLEEQAEAVTAGLESFLDGVVTGMCVREGDRPRVVQSYFLFTFLCAVVTSEQVLLFGMGDGVFAVNGEVCVLDAGEGNAPCYLGYRLLERTSLCAVGGLGVKLHYVGETVGVDSLLLGTDGAAEWEARAGSVLKSGRVLESLAQVVEDERYVKNPSWLQKRLNVLGQNHRWLQDDTTLVLFCRRSCGGC